MALLKLSSQKENVTVTGPCTTRTALTVNTGECYWLEVPVEAIPPPPPVTVQPETVTGARPC
jgi:hypothetical protein